MPRQVGTTVDNTFVAGLVTDSTVLNFPQNSCSEALNCVFDDSGKISRRKGLDFEGTYETKTITDGDYVIKSYVWSEVNGDGTQNILVVQTGSVLNFYDLSFPIISQGEIADEIDLEDFDISGATALGNYPCDFASGKGVLFVTHPRCNPFYVAFDSSTSNLSGTSITLQVRDLVGLDDGLAIDERPTQTVAQLSTEHKYNLYNQGWYYNSAAALGTWDTNLTTMPSNADIWWFYRDEDDVFDTTLVAKRTLGNTPAPKGHYILDAFNKDRTTASGISGISVESTGTNRPSVIAFFAGRVWYAGTQAAGQTNTIYYSQILEDLSQAGFCYQSNDPTAEDLNDLLPTDGGTVNVEGAGTVYAMRPLGNALLLFTSNGVWAITGSQGLGFVSTDYAVMKISSVNATSSFSFVDLDGSPCWWNAEGIFVVVSPDNVTFQVQSLTDRKIRNFIVNDIPVANKNFVTGAYNPSSKTVQWFFRSTEASNIFDATVYDKMLVFNLLTQAFYVWTFPTLTHAVKLHSVFSFKGFVGEVEPLQVVVDADDVVVDGDNVIAYDLEGSSALPIFKYVVTYLDGSDRELSFGETASNLYLDWPSYDNVGTDFVSTFTTGHKILGETQRFFQAPYAFVFLETEEGAGGYLQAVWDWTTSGNSGKWSSKQQIYNSALLYRDANFRRLKVRGKGRALQLRFTSETRKPFTISGWSLWVSGNSAL